MVNKFLLAEDKFIPEMHLRQPGFTYNASGSFTKNKEYNNSDKQEIQDIFIETNQIKLALWLMHMAYGDFKDLPRRATSGKVLCDEAFNIAKNPK